MRHFPCSSIFATESVEKYYIHEERMIAMLDDYFWMCFDYLRANEVSGDYLEFGCGFTARSFRLAAKYRAKWYDAPRLIAFDSFAGLPNIAEQERHPGWQAGDMAISIEEFKRLMRLQGLEDNDYKIVPGFFEKTLYNLKPSDYQIDRAAFVYIDCDLYSSTVPVLDFVSGILTNGSILAFDDWNCYKGDPKKGQKRAFEEFKTLRPEFSFTEFLPLGWNGRSFLVHREAASK